MGAGASPSVILRAGDVVDLQYFLMDAARRDATAGTSVVDVDALLATAAALDYTLLLASESGEDVFEAADAVKASVVETMTRAATGALDVVDAMIAAPAPVFVEFAERQLRRGGILDIVRTLRENGAVDGAVTAFREVTIASDVADRRAREPR